MPSIPIQPKPRNATLGKSLFLGLITAQILAGCNADTAQNKPPGRPPTTITTTRIMRGSIEDSETLDGQVVPYLQANIATQASGTVLSVAFNQGDHVRTGDVLARIDDSPLQAQLHEQQGSQAQAAAKLSQAQIQQPITAQASQSALAQAGLAVDQARKQLLADKAAVRQNDLTYHADEKLFSQGFVAETALALARSNFIASQQNLSIDQNRVAAAQAALESASKSMLNVNVQQQIVEESRGAVTQAAGNTQLLQTQIAQTVLRAPFDGVITQRMLDPGAFAGPNQPVYSLAQIDPVYVTFNVKDADLAYVHRGLPVSFSTSSLPNRVFHGRVRVINVVPSQGTLLYPARIILQNSDQALKGSMLVNVRIVKSHVDHALLAPASAVTQSLIGSSIYEVAGSGKNMIAKKIDVKVGIQNADMIEVSSPQIHAGMLIVNNKPDTLQDNAGVALVTNQNAPK